jgi:hypothetical protein
MNRLATYLIFTFSVGLVLLLAPPVYSGTSDPIVSSTTPKIERQISSQVYGNRYSNDILRGVTLKDIYSFNSKQTTKLGPAYANIVEKSSNFVKCSPPVGRKFTYALCYYSGPNQPTGNNPDNPPLPCKLSKNGLIANCTCYAISTDVAPAKVPYLVDINAISNAEIYNKTIESCGKDGEKCASGDTRPAVCEAINSNLLVPGADMVSVFSLLYMQNYTSGSNGALTNCTGNNAGLYAGCMTAPCQRTGKFDANGNELVNCECPVYKGPYQIGQADQSCDANQTTSGTSSSKSNTNVWSAAYNPSNEPLPPKSTSCTPDMAGKNGCPLYDPSTDHSQLISPTGALCTNVCAAYNNSPQTSSNVQVGYSCDATLCTTIGIGQEKNKSYSPSVKAQGNLINKACSGIHNISNFEQIMLVESLANCSCCASQVCGCDGISTETNQAIFKLNQEQMTQTIEPQCDINGTLCGKP